MGPETIVGQLRQDGTKDYIAAEMAKGKSFASAWEGIFGSLEYSAVMNKEVGREINIDWEGGGSDTLSAAQVIRSYIRKQPTLDDFGQRYHIHL
jgi:hypothetical protein